MSNAGFRLAFAGTPDLAATVLQALLEEGSHDLVHVFTRPDRPAGRGRKITASAVRQLADRMHLPISQPQSSTYIDPDNILAQTDMLIVAAFGMILPAEILTRPRLGCINVHASLLPRWRGAAPIQRAILAADRQTGITIMQMDEGLDTGDILLQHDCPIQPDDTAGELQERLAQLGATSLLETLAGMTTGEITPIRQDPARATYAEKIHKAEALIDWQQPASEIERLVRAFNPDPVAHTELKGMKMRIWAAETIPAHGAGDTPGTVVTCTREGLSIATGDQYLRIKQLQLPGKKPVSVRDFLNGHPEFLQA